MEKKMQFSGLTLINIRPVSAIKPQILNKDKHLMMDYTRGQLKAY